MVQAKFIVNHVASVRYTEHEQNEVFLTPVYGNGTENKQWAAATPSGEIKMLISNKEALEQFVPGKEVYIDFKIEGVDWKREEENNGC
jgi:hypothetical protein